MVGVVIHRQAHLEDDTDLDLVHARVPQMIGNLNEDLVEVDQDHLNERGTRKNDDDQDLDHEIEIVDIVMNGVNDF